MHRCFVGGVHQVVLTDTDLEIIRRIRSRWPQSQRQHTRVQDSVLPCRMYPSAATDTTEMVEFDNPEAGIKPILFILLGGAWVDRSGVISRLNVGYNSVSTIRINPLNTTHEPPSTTTLVFRERRSFSMSLHCSWCLRGQNTSRAKSTSTQSQIPSVEMGAHEGALLLMMLMPPCYILCCRRVRIVSDQSKV